MASLMQIIGFSAIIGFVCASDEAKDPVAVTCGSAIKLRHDNSNYHLHSHEIKWGSGSGQQSVTGFGGDDDNNDLWQVNGALNKACKQGTPVKCKDVVRMQHVKTNNFLHSHLHKSPLSHKQEVSAFFPSDTGDNWRVICKEDYWYRDQPVKFQHVDTKQYLYASQNAVFNRQNCGHQCPIGGQLEVACSQKATANCNWRSDQGFYFAMMEEAQVEL